MNIRKRTLWITTTAVFTALLIAVQAATALVPPPFRQFVTGTLVNLLLILSVLTCGPSSGLTVAVVSPIFAHMFGIGPILPIVPFIITGNAALVSIWHGIGGRKFAGAFVVRATAAAAAAVGKFFVLYVGVVMIAVPVLLDLPEQQASVLSGMFSVPQLFTALAGGAVAIAVLPVVEKARSAKSA